MHRSKWMFNLFHNLFMKLTMLKVCLFSTKLKTWTIVISTSFIYSESLWVRMAGIENFHQSLLIGFNSLSSHNIGLTLWTMVILKKDIWQSRFWTNNKVGTILPQSTTSQSTWKVYFNTLKWVWKLSFAFVGFLAWNWELMTPMAIIISCIGKQCSNFKTNF